MRPLPYIINDLELMPEIPGFNPNGSGGGSESQDGVLYCTDPSNGIVKIDIATETYELTGVITPTTALGYGHDGWWYANGGSDNVEARTLYRLQTELVRNPQTQIPEPVIEPIGSRTGASSTASAMGTSTRSTVPPDNRPTSLPWVSQARVWRSWTPARWS